ncbi:MAG: response regulator [Opitutus sp.]|nr:response regulator [Opitutus sp.]MCS6248270.1 response regulator [Opitutus sp.]MCS6274959.1 response regulator [Opitutus sp.]MCS6279009.1 response regulator [Opitutus sp.]MCS6298758.1 response regulator [Opitutus sp.]
MKLLIVDDSLVMRRIVGSAAALLGAECVEAANGEQAFVKLQEDPAGFNLICLDWNMPVMSGLEFLKALRADPRWIDIPVLMITTEGSRDSIIEALKTGATGYLTKPFNQQDLQSKMMDCLGLG